MTVNIGGEFMIETYTCKNGVRIVLENITTVRSVTMGVWVGTGSRYESETNGGISHFLEHMFFKGTKTKSAQEIAESFDAIGGQVNAFTSKEYTCYYARVLDTYKVYAMEVLADMFFHSVFPEDEIEREKKVVLEEIKMYEDSPDSHVHDLLAKANFGNHPLGRPIIGTEALVRSFTKKSLQDYRKECYVPENVVISIAGNVDVTFIQTVEHLFDQFEQQSQLMERTKPTMLFDTIVKHKEIEQAHACFGFRGIAVDDERMPALMVLNSALGNGMSSRLFQEVREKRGLAYSVFSYHSAYLDSGVLGIYAGTNKEQLPLLEETIIDTIEDIKKNGLMEKEFHNKKEQLKGNLVLGSESTNSRMSRNGRNELLLKKHRTLDELLKEIDQVDHMMINEVIEHIFTGKYSKAVIMSETK